MSIMQSRKVCVIKHGKLFNNTFFAFAHNTGDDLYYYGDWIKIPDKQYAVAMTAYVT